jgi:adenine nucleotide transporter 17
LCLKPALQYTIFEQVKATIVAGRAQKHLNAAESFILGMVARTISTVFIFPYIRAKVVLQTSKSNEDGKPATSIPDMLREMYKDGGFAAWFQGLGPELTRGVLSSALMLMIKEQIGQMVQSALEPQPNKRLHRPRRV